MASTVALVTERKSESGLFRASEHLGFAQGMISFSEDDWDDGPPDGRRVVAVDPWERAG